MYKAGFALLLLGAIQLASAEGEGTSYDRITIEASASEQVGNDTLVALLYLQRQGRDTARLADDVNRAINWGIERVRRVPGVKIQTPDYQTTPVYQNGKPTGIWRVRQSLRLESRDATLLSGLLGELQEKLAVQQIGYLLSEEGRRRTEEELIKRAIARFKQKAQLVTQQFDAREYRIVSLHISSSGQHGRPVAMRFAMEGSRASTPTLEAGEQTVRIAVNGIIELVRE